MTTLDTRIGDIRLDQVLLGASSSQTLSDPEAQILLLLAVGKQNVEIAAAVGTDQAAVKDHIKSILRKAIAAGGRGPKTAEAMMETMRKQQEASVA